MNTNIGAVRVLRRVRIKKQNVETVAQFVAMPNDQVRDLLTLVGAKTQAELQGRVCFPFNDARALP